MTKNIIILHDFIVMKSLLELIAAVQLLQKAETERTKIILELKQEISDLQTKVSELIQRDKFVTELIDDNHTESILNNMSPLKSPFKIKETELI